MCAIERTITYLFYDNFYGEKQIFCRTPYSLRERFFESFYYRGVLKLSEGI